MPYLYRTDRKTKKQLKILKIQEPLLAIYEKGFFENKYKEERYSRVPRLSGTRYSANGTKGKWRYASSKPRLK